MNVQLGMAIYSHYVNFNSVVIYIFVMLIGNQLAALMCLLCCMLLLQ